MWRAAVFTICLACSADPRRADELPVDILRLSQVSTVPGTIDYAALPRLGGTHAVVSAAALDRSAREKPKIDLHNIRFQLHNYLAHHADRFSGVASLQYPHMIEHNDHLLIAYSRNKHQTEVLRVSLDDVDKLMAQ